MVSQIVTIKSVKGIPSRAPIYYVRKANEYKSNISVGIANEDRCVNAKSLLGVLSLGMAEDMKIEICAEGDDEALAVKGLVEFIENGFEN